MARTAVVGDDVSQAQRHFDDFRVVSKLDLGYRSLYFDFIPANFIPNRGELYLRMFARSLSVASDFLHLQRLAFLDAFHGRNRCRRPKFVGHCLPALLAVAGVILLPSKRAPKARPGVNPLHQHAKWVRTG